MPTQSPLRVIGINNTARVRTPEFLKAHNLCAETRALMFGAWQKVNSAVIYPVLKGITYEGSLSILTKESYFYALSR